MTTANPAHNLPAISVVIPALQIDARLVVAVESVLAEAPTVDLELIVVIDGPIGALTADWVRHHRVRVLHTGNRSGTSAAMNLGIRASTAPLIGRLDADDVSLPGRLAAQMNYLQEHPNVALVGTRGRLIDEDGTDIGGYPPPGLRDVRRQLLSRNPFLHSSLVMRRGTLDAAGGYDEACPRMQDYELLLRIALNHQVAILDEELVAYRIHGDQSNIRMEGFWRVARRVSAARRALARREGRHLFVQSAHDAVFLSAQLLRYWGWRQPRYNRASLRTEVRDWAVDHVIHVSQPDSAGVANVVSKVVAQQLDDGLRVSVVCPPGGPLAQAVSTLGAQHELWLATRSPGPQTLWEAATLRNTLRRLTTVGTVVHLHSSKAGLVGRFPGVVSAPIVFQPHGWSFLASGKALNTAALFWERLASRRNYLTVCVSDDELAQARRVGLLNNGERVRVVTNPVATPAHLEHRSAARRRLGMDDAPAVVCIGRLCPAKGQDRLLDAWDHVLTTVPHARLFLVGDGPDEDALLAREATGVTFAGWSDDVEGWLAAADVVVAPSRWEGMSLSVLQSIAAGRPVVASGANGMREILARSNQHAGVVVDPFDEQTFASEVVRRLLDPELCALEGRTGRTLASEVFDEGTWRLKVRDVLLALGQAPKHRRGLVGFAA